MARVVAELGPEARDVDVDRPVERLLGAALHELEEALARDDLPRPLREDAQQLELVGGEGQLAPPPGGAERLGIEGELAEHDRPGGGAGLAARPAHLGLDPREELARLGWAQPAVP